MTSKLFIGVFSTGISYADRSREKDGDYVSLAFLSFKTLELKIQADCRREFIPSIREHAAKIQARRGESYEISTCGQTITLGK